MTTTPRIDSLQKPAVPQPYAMVGAGELTSAIWKTGHEASGWRYRFNLFRLSPSGQMGHRFRPLDLVQLVKLARVLTAALIDDGCLRPAERAQLVQLASLLEEFMGEVD